MSLASNSQWTGRLPHLPPEQTATCLSVDCVDGRSKRLSNLGGPNSSRALEPQGVTVADFPTGNELDAANGIIQEDAAIGINRKLVVDSLKASILQRSCFSNVRHPTCISYSHQHCCCLVWPESFHYAM